MGINHQVYHRYICTSAEESLVARGWRWDWYHCGVCQSRAGWMEVHRRYQWWNLMVLHCDWNIQTGGCQVLEPKFRLFRGIWTRAIQSFTTINIKKKKNISCCIALTCQKIRQAVCFRVLLWEQVDILLMTMTMSRSSNLVQVGVPIPSKALRFLANSYWTAMLGSV